MIFECRNEHGPKRVNHKADIALRCITDRYSIGIYNSGLKWDIPSFHPSAPPPEHLAKLSSLLPRILSTSNGSIEIFKIRFFWKMGTFAGAEFILYRRFNVLYKCVLIRNLVVRLIIYARDVRLEELWGTLSRRYLASTLRNRYVSIPKFRKLASHKIRRNIQFRKASNSCE